MSRVQLALNVSDLEEAIDFYTTLFATRPAKVRPGYANFAISEPPLKLVLFENAEAIPGSLNHLGVEVETTIEVADAKVRLDNAGITTALEEETTCCYARQDKVWVNGPGRATWEIYTVLEDSEIETGTSPHTAPLTAICCTGLAQMPATDADEQH